MVRIHRRPRRELFTSLRVSGAPPVKTLAMARMTGTTTFMKMSETSRFEAPSCE